MVKYVVVTGGSLSGLGKGTLASSIGVILRSAGYRVTAIKIDPYLNIDAGTISPNEHGEVYVLADGHEGDLDLGNYERALNVSLTGDHNMTTGKVYRQILQAERNGDYLGATVQVVPHVTDAIQAWIMRIAKKSVDGLEGSPDVCLVEVGGTVGDIESSVYLEALQQFFSRVPREDYALCHLTYVPTIGAEQKTKCAQHSFRELREAGLTADFVFGRCQVPLMPGSRRKMSVFSGVKESRVLSLPDVPVNYLVPLGIEKQNFAQELLGVLQLPVVNPNPMIHYTPVNSPVALWSLLAERSVKKAEKKVKIGMVGKYLGSNDTYLSVVKALEHSASEIDVDLEIVWIQADFLVDGEAATEEETEKRNLQWTNLKRVDGILAPGGFGDRGIEGKINAAKYARENDIPYFGICLGMQTALIEGARNLLNLKDAHSEEFSATSENKIVVYMPETINQVMGGTMRLGNRETYFKDREGLVFSLYDKHNVITERHRHRYEFNIDYKEKLEKVGYAFVGMDETGNRLEVIERPDNRFFVACQYHPEFTSRIDKPNNLFLGFILASCGMLEERFKQNDGCLRPGSSYTKF